MKDAFGNEVEFANTEKICSNLTPINELLTEIGKFMGWASLDDVWVSDESTMSDFGLSEEELKEISNKIRVPISRDDYLHEIAHRMFLREAN